ncbi:deoxyguanosine kinase, mitochondrial-like [Pleurodeles waltl]|uniref:deoxyguanosine kinase, mitochondrial-like n=1 Tax=Pleurodeles waltl TaxID=8319 RepID=UPI003709BF7F
MSLSNSWMLPKTVLRLNIIFPKVQDYFFSAVPFYSQRNVAGALTKYTVRYLNTSGMMASSSIKTPSVKRLSIEGNIAVGKSTFLTTLAKAFPGWHMVTEPVKKWQHIQGSGACSKNTNLLQLMYQDPSRWSYTFQTFSCMGRLKAQLEPCSEQVMKIENPVQIFERSVYSDRYVFAKNLFDLGHMSEIEWTIYQDWHSFLLQQFKDQVALNGILYLQATPEKCFERLRQRGRSEEEQVELGYLKDLHVQHEHWLTEKCTKVHFENIKNVPVLVLDANKDFKDNPEEEEILTDKVKTFLANL